MAEDRMLSDEILLGLINKNSGGGGGGTTNYNNLENKPQIGGVTLPGQMTASDLGLATETALADKADKSAVKNEFLGTLDEWNALTIEQRKTYDTYQIKGDYTEGSGGLPDYSTTEQKTGQKWIDGKDIYFKTVEFGALPNNAKKSVDSGLTGETIIKMYGIAKSDNDYKPLPSAATNAIYTVTLGYDSADHQIVIYTATNMTSYSAYVVLEYTKTT